MVVSIFTVYYTTRMGDTKKEPHSYQMPLRLDDDERAKLEAIASMWRLSLAATIRRLIREKRIRRDDERG